MTMNETQIDQFLFDEMTDAEREQFEKDFIADDDLFYELADRENALVDAYAKGQLRGAELSRFEKTIATMAARRQKIANAKKLQELIADERVESKTITLAEHSGILPRIAQLFTFRSPAFQFAAVALIAVLAVSSVLLLRENRRLGSLELELAQSRQRETDLTTQIEDQQEASSDLTADLDAERERVRQLEATIANVRQTPADPHSTAPTIATLILSPVSFRGGPPLVKHLDLEPAVSRISTILNLFATNVDRVSVRLNGDMIAEGLEVRTRNNERSVSLTIPSGKVKDGRNDLSVFDSSGKQLEEFSFSVSRQKRSSMDSTGSNQ